MSHRTAATALLLASLPYGLALPQVIPLANGLVPNITPRPLPLVAPVNGSTVTVIGTVVQPAVESAVDVDVDAATDAVDDAVATKAPAVLDPEANTLPLVLPGLLPVETDLPSLNAPDAGPASLYAAPSVDNGTVPEAEDDLPETNELGVIFLPPVVDEVPYGDDGLVAPTPPAFGEEYPYGNDAILAPTPYVPDFSDLPDEATVPISTFNAVVQPLLSVIQSLLNSLPGNYVPPFPGILPHPLLPTGPPEIFIDPLLPTATATPDIVDPLAPLVDPVPTPASGDVPFAKRFAKRQDLAGVESGITTASIIELLVPILEAISALVEQIPGVGPVADAIEEPVDETVEVPPLPVDVPELPVDVPTLPIDVPAVEPPVLPAPDISLPDISLPDISLPDLLPSGLPDISDILPDVSEIIPDISEILPNISDILPDISDILPDVSDILPDAVLPDVSALPAVPDVVPAVELPAPVPELPLPSLPASLPDVPDLTSGIPDEVLNVPIPDDIEGVDWAAFESPPFSDLPPVAQPLDDAIPDDVLNVPVPDFDEWGNPIDTPLDAVSDAAATAPAAPPALDALADATAAAPVALPTSLDALGDLDDLLDWPFEDIPETIAPDLSGELPDLNDLPLPDEVLSLPVPETDDLSTPLADAPLAGLLLPAPALTLALPSEILALAAPTDLLDIPVPDDFEDVADVPGPTAVPAPPLPDFDIPWDILNIPVPDFDEFGNPLDTPIEATDASPNAPLPTDLNFFDIPVPEGFEDFGDALDLPAPTAVVSDVADVAIPDDILNLAVPDFDENGFPIDDTAAPALPTEAFGAGFPIQALPDVPLVLPADVGPADVLPSLPADGLLPAEGLPTEALTGLTAVLTDALSGLPTAVPVDAVGAPALPTVAALSPAPELPAGDALIAPSLAVIPVVEDVTAVVTAVPVPEVPSVAAPALPAVPTAVVPPVAAPAAPIPTLATVVSALPVAVPALPLQVPGVRSPLGKRQLALLSKPKVPAVAATPSVDSITLQLIKPLVNLLNALIKKFPSTPKLPLPVPLPLPLPVPVPGVNLPAVPAPPVVPPLPVVPDVAAIIASILPSLPVPDVASVLPVGPLPVPEVASILPAVPLPVPDVASVLPEVPALTVVPEVPSILPAPASILPLPEVASILPADLPAVADLTTDLPALPVETLPVFSDVADDLPPVDGIADTIAVFPDLTGPISAVPGIGETVSTVADAVAAAPDVASLLPELPTGPIPRIRRSQVDRLARRAVEEFQQGPASDWEAFLGELDESHRGELHRLVHDSAKAVNNNNVEGLAAQLKEDFASLSAETKSKLQNAAPMLANTQKRSMRHGKRQSIPGVLSIGPNLDNAEKVDLSFLGSLGSLNPFGQPLDDVAPAPLVDDVAQALDAPVFIPGELADSSVDSGSSPEAAALLAAGGLDPFGMNSPGGGSPVDDLFEPDPYTDIRPADWDAALAQGRPKEALEGLDATLQAAKNNKFTERPANIPFASSLQGGSAAAAQAAAKAAQQQGVAQGVAQEQGEVLRWFQRFVKPSWNKNVDPEIVR